MKQAESDTYTDKEAARRRDEVIKRMLNTPPQPRRAKLPKEAKKRSARKARPKSPS
jgi:hypothetical protein